MRKFYEEFRGLSLTSIAKSTFMSIFIAFVLMAGCILKCGIYAEAETAQFVPIPIMEERIDMLSNIGNGRPINSDEHIELYEAIEQLPDIVETLEASSKINETAEAVIIEEEPITYNEYFTLDTDLGKGFSGVTAEMLDAATLYYNQYQDFENPFIDKGYIFIEAQEQSGLDALFIYTLAVYESGWGTSRFARERSNYFGIGSWDEDLERTAYMGDSLSTGIINGACWIAENYYNNDNNVNKVYQTTLNLMNSVPHHSYAPGNDKWGPNTVNFINNFYENWRNLS